MKKELNYLGVKATVEIKDENEHIQKHWNLGQYYETQRNGLLNYIHQNDPKGGKYIDVGASIGNHSVFFLQVMEASELVCFEPNYDSYLHLRENIEIQMDEIRPRLKELETVPVALGAEVGTCEIEKDSHNVGMRSVIDMPGDDGSVQVFPLDDYYDEVKDYDVLKVDIEHYNEPFLKGAARTLTDGNGTVYIEAESPEELEVVDRYMTDYGYSRVEGIVLNHTPTYVYNKNS